MKQIHFVVKINGSKMYNYDMVLNLVKILGAVPHPLCIHVVQTEKNRPKLARTGNFSEISGARGATLR